MTNKATKPKLLPKDIITKMKNSGITFKYTSESDAELYLSSTNNYLRTACYRKNFEKRQAGTSVGTYIDLDFDYLKDLSTIDMHLRYLIIKMSIEIEHSIKQKLIYEIDIKSSEDGYSIVKEYLSSNTKSVTELANNIQSGYTEDLASKYLTIDTCVGQSGHITKTIADYDDCPVWVYTELISFGQLIKFYDFCKSKLGFAGTDTKLINCVRSLRNACAHNNCILSDLRKQSTRPTREIVLFQSTISGIPKRTKEKKMKNRTIVEFITLLYTYKQCVSPTIQNERVKELMDLFKNRIIRNKRFYTNNVLLKSVYTFVKQNIDALFPIQSVKED